MADIGHSPFQPRPLLDSKTEFNGDRRVAKPHQNRAGPLTGTSSLRLRPAPVPGPQNKYEQCQTDLGNSQPGPEEPDPPRNQVPRPITKPSRPVTKPLCRLMKRSRNKGRLLDVLYSKPGSAKMIAITAILGLFSAGIFVAHTVDAYRAP